MATMAAVGYALAGGAGAAALATTGPALMHEYAAAASTHQTVIATQFTILVEVVWRGIWQFLDAILLAGWWRGSIFWTAESGAHVMNGPVMPKWAQLGWERGALGYPTSDEFQDGDGRRRNFAHGSITWSEATGAQASVSLEGDVVLNPVND